MSDKNSEVSISNIVAKWFNQDFCWKCGNRGYWTEQIDGLDNQRIVYCDCGAQAEKDTQ